METALLQNDAAYALVPSELTVTERTPSSPTPSAHAPPLPLSLTHPAVPGSCCNAPVAGFRLNTETASLTSEPT